MAAASARVDTASFSNSRSTYVLSQILIYAALLAAATFGPLIVGLAGWLYGVGVAVLDALFLALALRLWHDDGHRPAPQLFAYSIVYLGLLFGLLLVDAAVLQAL